MFPERGVEQWTERPRLTFRATYLVKVPSSLIFPSLNEKVNCTTRRLVSGNNLGIPGIQIFAEVRKDLGTALMVFQG